MRVRTFQLIAAAGTALLLSWAAVGGARAQSPAPALSGQIIRTDQAGPMEGVLVSAQNSQSPITITVVSDQNGRFSFPAAKLAPGHYSLRVRATGYELEGPQAADVAQDKTANVDLKLRKTKDLAAQLTNTEWFMSFPGTTEQKRALIECMSCHTLERIARSKFSADEFMPVLKRMTTYANNTIQARVQRRVAEVEFPEDRARKVAEYLSTINLSKSESWSYPLQTLPRPTGAATRVVVTEYALPRQTIAPHDVRTDANGFVWYSDFVENDLGRLDPKTGALKEFPYPELKPGFPTGALALEPDADGNLWLAMMFQAGLARFDVKTETFRLFPVQSELNIDTTQQSLLTPRHLNVDGKVWTNDVRKQAVLRLDLATGKYEVFDPFRFTPKGRQHSPYGMVSDAANNLYFMDFGDENVGRVDAKTGQATIYPTPTPRSRPRRTMMDAQGRVWFAEFGADKVGMFDPKQEKFAEWNVPTPHTYPYDVFLDRNGELWSGSMSSDRILRMDPQTGKAIEYLLPRSTNIRRVFVDDSTNPVTFWAGNNHGAEIIKLQPLD
ncbi:MAG TPA: carboxypeptidase regulatory-like domain-containing protein [Xanthobacteraceae bacterium]|nr:carboxypeptidase regulatory-like domain-containing protein [Xanthobacteraceae bacterium]